MTSAARTSSVVVGSVCPTSPTVPIAALEMPSDRVQRHRPREPAHRERTTPRSNRAAFSIHRQRCSAVCHRRIAKGWCERWRGLRPLRLPGVGRGVDAPSCRSLALARDHRCLGESVGVQVIGVEVGDDFPHLGQRGVDDPTALSGECHDAESVRRSPTACNVAKSATTMLTRPSAHSPAVDIDRR